MPKRFEGGRRRRHSPAIGNLSRPEIHCVKRGDIAVRYLRAAHAYMLISMPTGTSTILGVFQAILALLVKWDELALPNKLLRKEKYASEIFCYLPHVFMLQRKKELTLLCS